MSSRKRKYRGQHLSRTRGRYEEGDEVEGSWQEPEQHWQHPTHQEPEYDPALHIVAHEADIERGPGAARAADALEARLAGQSGSSLIKLGWRSLEGKEVWVDRYDARLLLDERPAVDGAWPYSSSPPRSPSPGWSDLPSDAEDTFFLAPEDIEDYERDKRRRAIERLREDRMRALAADDEEVVEEDPWGGSDEEPDDAQRAIMQRTAGHLLVSPNAAQLEMRILANHGSKREFSFLRGRWARAWASIKAQVRAQKERPAQKKTDVGLGGLTAYGSDSSDGSEQEEEVEPSVAEQTDIAPSNPPNGTTLQESASLDEDTAKEARRVRAREWAERRRTEKSTADA